ncbi:MAG: peptidase domain-containing ABC transporter [Cytophagales bacterium]|nr:peptidase domain-containing ABC transporter [Cytophagales bacterium]
MNTNLKTLRKHHVLQHGQSDCGVACLAAIIRQYGGEKSLDEIRRLSGTTKTGTSLLGLFQGANVLGFDCKGMEAEGIDNLKELNEPAILHVLLENKLEHYVVFHGFENGQLIIGDPSKGVELWDCEKLEEVWHSKTLLKLTPNDSFVKSSSTSGKYTNLINWVKEDINILLSSLFLGILIATFSLATAVFSQKLIDVILPTKELAKLTVGLVLFGFVLLMKTGLSYVRSTFLITQSRDFNNRMISSFFKSLLNLPKSFFDSKKTGEMIARMNDTRRIQSTVSGLVGNLLIEFLIIITSLIGVLVYSWQIGLVVLGFVPFYLLIIWKLNRPIISSQKEVMSAYALNESNYIDVISGISEVKSTDSIGLFHKTTTLLYGYFQERIFSLGRIQIRFGILTETVGILLLLSVISFASVLVLQDQLLLGSMMAILTLSGSIGPSLARIAVFNIEMQEAKVAFSRMEEFTGLDAEQMNGDTLNNFDFIELSEVSFSYPGTLSLLNSISLVAKKGSITSLLGESGSGKSTILQLIQRFYETTSGEIRIGDMAIDSLEIDSLRGSLGVVPQEVKIFNSYLLFNIALTEDQNELEGVQSWCEESGFASYFEKFPQGYMTLLGEEGSNISGGQKQLVALARALYRKPQLLLIDEGTSAMDRETEKFVMSVLQKLKSEVAILMVTHKLQTALESDMLYLLENGGIIDSGEPKDLLKKKNFLSRNYQELVKRM